MPDADLGELRVQGRERQRSRRICLVGGGEIVRGRKDRTYGTYATVARLRASFGIDPSKQAIDRANLAEGSRRGFPFAPGVWFAPDECDALEVKLGLFGRAQEVEQAAVELVGRDRFGGQWFDWVAPGGQWTVGVVGPTDAEVATLAARVGKQGAVQVRDVRFSLAALTSVGEAVEADAPGNRPPRIVKASVNVEENVVDVTVQPYTPDRVAAVSRFGPAVVVRPPKVRYPRNRDGGARR